MVSYRVLLGLVAVALAAAPGVALAQSLPIVDCSVQKFRDGPAAAAARVFYTFDATACSRAEISRQLLIHMMDVVPMVVRQSLGIGPDSIEPAGLEQLTPTEAAARLVGGDSIVISATADAPPVAAPANKWNIWADGKYTWNDNSPANFNLDGGLWNGLVGIDYKLTPKITLGVMASTESSDLNGTGVDTSSRGWGAGPYLGIVLTDHLVLSASVLGSSIDSNQTSFIHLGFKSDRLQASTGLNGYWYNDGWRFTPGLNTSWSKEWEKETLGTTPDETLETGLLTPGLQLGKTLKLSDRATVEPWAGAAFDWTYVNRIKFAGLPASNDPSTDLRIQAGLNFAFGSNVQLALTAEAGGLLLKNLDTYAGEANLAIQF